MAKKPAAQRSVEALTHDEAKRKNIPTAEFQSVLEKEQQDPKKVRFPRNTDLDPQLVWRGKDGQDWSDLVVHAPPLYIQEKVHPKVLIDDLLRETREKAHEAGQFTPDLFADFNGIPKDVDKTEFYQHDQNWSNRMILGDSLQVVASLAEREGLRGKVQCIYLDPPYGIKFNSNFQWSTTSRDVKDGNAGHITREPEQVKAFRDTWRDGVHSYLTYLRDRLTVARDLLTDSGSIFVQIGDENVHLVRSVMDEVFGADNYIAQIIFRKTSGKASDSVDITVDFLLLYARSRVKIHRSFEPREIFSDQNMRSLQLHDGQRRPLTKDEVEGKHAIPKGARVYRNGPITSSRPLGEGDLKSFELDGVSLSPGKGTFKTNLTGLTRLKKAGRLLRSGNTLGYLRFFEDFAYGRTGDVWDDTRQSGFGDPKTYVVQTAARVLERCIHLTTDPGDLVLDPTCGSGTAAMVAEQWGRRWITIDTSRVALALARARIMGARYPYYLLADSREGQLKEAEITRTAPSSQPVHGNIRHGFVYERVPHITLKSIANNAEIDVIWDKWQAKLEPLRESLNSALKKQWQEWEIPRDADKAWPDPAKKLHADWWQARIARQCAPPDHTGRAIHLVSGCNLDEYEGGLRLAVVDEAQDIGVSHLRFIAALVGPWPKSNALFFAGDLGQRIFQQPFSWKALGVDVRGRSRTLRVNYRTSHQIRTQADRLLGPVVTDADGNSEDRSNTVSVFNGPPPTIHSLKTESEETALVSNWIAERAKAGVLPHEFGVFVRSAAQLDRARAAVKAAGLAFKISR